MPAILYYIKDPTVKHTLPPLPYAYDALEPHIDAKTMEIHHTKHHQGYVTNLNNALATYPSLQKMSLEELLKNIDTIPSNVHTAVQNHGGGHANHSFFWPLMKKNGGGEPRGKIARAIEQHFGNFSSFKEQFSNKARSLFGSGWTWISVDSYGALCVSTTPNQESPLSEGLLPILGLDVWEHAYYLAYQNRRPDYIAAWWHVINWDRVEELYCNNT